MADVAVIGVPHAVLGEEVGAAVVLRPGPRSRPRSSPATSGSAWRRSRCPPTSGSVSEPLPRNPQGKVLKRELRDALVGDAGRRRSTHRTRSALTWVCSTGRRAVVTGGGSGIGRAACQRFAAEGAAVAVLDIDGDGAQATAEEVDGIGLRRGRDRRRGPARAPSTPPPPQLGGVSILVNNAGGSTMAPPGRTGTPTSGTASSGST